MSAAMHELLAILDLEQLEHNLFRGRSPKTRLAARLRRPDDRAGAGRGAAHRRARPPRPFAARLFHAAGRSEGADHLRSRPHPRRRQLHHPSRRRDPARPGDLFARSLVPGSTRAAWNIRRRCRSTCRRPKPCSTSASSSASSAKRCPKASGATGSATGPIEMKPVMLEHYTSSARSWSRARTSGSARPGRCPTTVRIQAAVLAYLSDMTLLDTSTFAHGRGDLRPGHPGRQPRPRHVVSPHAPARRLAALHAGQPLHPGRAWLYARRALRPGRHA